jgi:DNA primase
MIPIHSSSGRVVAFGGRKLDENKQGGKYINSPTTLIYTKGKEVFGLHLTKYEIGKKDFVLISEGYLDMLRLYDMGFTNSVASLGTALTNEQISLLGRYTQNFYIIYDGDDAGVKAAKTLIAISSKRASRGCRF